CRQVLCGRNVQVASRDSSQLRDWWVRSVPSGGQAGNWHPACSGTANCNITVSDNLVVVGVPSGVSPDSVASVLPGEDLDWLTSARPNGHTGVVPRLLLLELANIGRASHRAVDAVSRWTAVDSPLN